MKGVHCIRGNDNTETLLMIKQMKSRKNFFKHFFLGINLDWKHQ